MKRNQFVLVAMALLIAFGMTACPTDVEDEDAALPGSLSFANPEVYVGDPLQVVYTTTGKEKPIWTWVGPDGVIDTRGADTVEATSVTKPGKYIVTGTVVGFRGKSETIVVGPAEIKNFKWHWQGSNTGTNGGQTFSEDIVITNSTFKLNNSITNPASDQDGKEYFYFKINDWSIVASGTGNNTYASGFKMTGTMIGQVGYTTYANFNIYLDSQKTKLVRTNNAATPVIITSTTPSGVRTYERQAITP